MEGVCGRLKNCWGLRVRLEPATLDWQHVVIYYHPLSRGHSRIDSGWQTQSLHALQFYTGHSEFWFNVLSGSRLGLHSFQKEMQHFWSCFSFWRRVYASEYGVIQVGGSILGMLKSSITPDSLSCPEWWKAGDPTCLLSYNMQLDNAVSNPCLVTCMFGIQVVASSLKTKTDFFQIVCSVLKVVGSANILKCMRNLSQGSLQKRLLSDKVDWIMISEVLIESFACFTVFNASQYNPVLIIYQKYEFKNGFARD